MTNYVPDSIIDDALRTVLGDSFDHLQSESLSDSRASMRRVFQQNQFRVVRETGDLIPSIEHYCTANRVVELLEHRAADLRNDIAAIIKRDSVLALQTFDELPDAWLQTRYKPGRREQVAHVGDPEPPSGDYDDWHHEPATPLFIRRIPEGWMLVPLEPTLEMIQAYLGQKSTSNLDQQLEVYNGYMAMCKVAPKPAFKKMDGFDDQADSQNA